MPAKRPQAANPRAANHPFCKAQAEFQELVGKLQHLNARNFGVDVERDRNWGEVGSVSFVNGLLRQALEHYGIEA